MKKFLLAVLAALTLGAGMALIAAPAQADDTIPVPGVPVIESFHTRGYVNTFYPTVRDGFRDGIDFRGRSAEILGADEYGNEVYADLSWKITVRNSNGYKVAEKIGIESPAVNLGTYWDWNGKNQRTGRPVAVGSYKATLTVTNEDTDESATRVLTLKATSDTVNRRITKSRYGYDTSSRWRRGDCEVTRDGWLSGPNSLYLDCRGGSTGVRYGFALPANARNVTWSAPTEHGFGWSGHLRKSGTRTSARHFDVKVSVDGWEAYSIKRANVTYTTTVRR